MQNISRRKILISWQTDERMMIKFVSVLSEICDSYLDNDGLNPVNAAQVHCDISEGLGLPAPSQGRVEPEIEINIQDNV